MKITVFGATGGVGQQVVKQAVAAGHDVVAVVRNPQKLPERVTFVRADLSTATVDQVVRAVRKSDAVLSCLGPRSRAEAQAGIVTTATRLIIDATKEAGPRRLIVISAVPVGTTASPARPNPPASDPGDGWMVTNVMTPIVKTVFKNVYRDLAAMEDIVRESGLDWTIARPPRLLDKKLTGQYRTHAFQNLPGGRAIGRADLAHFMLAAVQRQETVGQAVRVTY